MDSFIIEKYKEVKATLKLKDRYFQIFELRNGLSDGRRYTLNETGKRFGISGSRARQIEVRVMYEVIARLS